MKEFKICTFLCVNAVLILCFCISCKKFIEGGIVTNLTGLASDPVSQKPIPNCSICIREYVGGFYGPKFSKVIDSTKSDINGNYSISFTTTGQGLEYRLAFFSPPNYFSLQDASVITIGKDNTINFSAFKVHILKARVIVVNNPNPPLSVYTIISGSGSQISGKAGDSTVFLKVTPNVGNLVYFAIRNIDTPTISNLRIDTVLLSGFADTFSHTFQVNPKFYKRRL